MLRRSGDFIINDKKLVKLWKSWTTSLKRLRGGSAWSQSFTDALPAGFTVKTHAGTESIAITGGGVSLAVRPLATGVYQFRAPLSGDAMELVWADSLGALKVARHLGAAVGASCVVHAALRPAAPLVDVMQTVDARQFVADDWVDRSMLMLDVES